MYCLITLEKAVYLLLLLLWRVIATCAWFHQTKKHGRQDSNDKLNNAENRYWHTEILIHPNSINIFTTVIVGNGCAVTGSDCSTKHGRYDGEAHKYASLGVEIRKQTVVTVSTIYIRKNHRRTGRGGCSPPKFWASQLFWAAKEIWAKPVFKEVSMFLFFEEIDIFYFNLKSAW